MTDSLVDVLRAHQPGEDWHCRCGEDLFGGSDAYSFSLYLAHTADRVRGFYANALTNEKVQRAVAASICQQYAEWTDVADNDRDAYRDDAAAALGVVREAVNET